LEEDAIIKTTAEKGKKIVTFEVGHAIRDLVNTNDMSTCSSSARRVEIKTVHAIINACSLLDSMESSPNASVKLIRSVCYRTF